MKWGVVIAGATAALMTGTANASLQVETAPFIAASIGTMDFESLGDSVVNTGTPYSEGGIALEYVWPDNPDGPQPVAGEGWGLAGSTHGLYASDFKGYTDIQLTDGSGFDQIQFDAASGFGDSGATSLQYELLYNGVVVATGATGPLPSVNTGSSTFGFSGLTFDEVRLRNDHGLSAYQETSSSDALALDNILIGRSAVDAVPEPATWAFMVVALGMTGGMLRRRSGYIARISPSEHSR